MTTPAETLLQIAARLLVLFLDWIGCESVLYPTDRGRPNCAWCGTNHALVIARQILGDAR